MDVAGPAQRSIAAIKRLPVAPTELAAANPNVIAGSDWQRSTCNHRVTTALIYSSNGVTGESFKHTFPGLRHLLVNHQNIHTRLRAEVKWQKFE
jgi:hypothetical protein